MINNIDTVLVLASGYSNAFDIPPCLLKVDHQTLIKRTVNILKNRNIHEIFIIVGYKKDLIIEELENENVNFIIISIYTSTGTMKSVRLLKYLKKDFLLIEDNLFFDENILITLLELTNPNCIPYTALNESIEPFGDNWLVFKYFILKCSNWPISYINVDNNTWVNIDSNEQFNKAIDVIYSNINRKISGKTFQFITNYLHQAIGTKPEEIRGIEFSGGMTNKNYKITLMDGNELLIRVPGAGTNSLVNRHNEMINSKSIAALEIDVPTFYFNAQDGVKIAKYVKNAQTLSKQTAGITNNMENIATILKKLHTSDIKMNNAFSFISIMQDYESVIITKTNKYYIDKKYPNFSKKKEKIELLNDKIQQLKSFSLCPCHNDLVPENFIKSSEGKLFLIDWEYSGYNNPFWDLAAYILESELTNIEEQKFLEFYFQRPLLEEEYFQLNFYKAVQDVLWSLWTIVKELHGESFGDYGHNRYERGYKLLKGLESC